jgi:hypothetical protein
MLLLDASHLMSRDYKENSMDFASYAKLAVDLGVVPAVALFLIFAMHLQNRRLTALLEKKDEQMNTMLERKDQQAFEVIGRLVTEVAEFQKQRIRGK